MRKHLNNLYVQYVLTAIFCFGFFVYRHTFFFCYLTHCFSWQCAFLDTCVSWQFGFLKTNICISFFFLRLLFFCSIFFFSSVFISNYFSRTSYLNDSWLCFFFLFFFFSRQLICENTSITCIYMRWNNRQILVRFFCIYCQTYFCFLKLWVSLYMKTKFGTSFFSRDVVFMCFMAFFFFWTIFVGVFDISKFSACFSFFSFFFLSFFYCCCYYSLLYVDHLKWEKNKQGWYSPAVELESSSELKA